MRVLGFLVPAFLAPGCAHTVELRHPPDLSVVADLERFPYEDWAGVLESFVDERGSVDYDALRNDRVDLDRFAGLLSVVGTKTRPDLFPTREDRLAYHLNAYNAFVLLGVIDRPELRTVDDEKAGFFYFTRYRLDGGEICLFDLENEVIRKEYREPRSHFALNCGSWGCPRLTREPFVGARLEEQLHRGTEEFLDDSRNVAVEGGVIVVSEIFDWYAEDFTPSPVAWIASRRPDLRLERGRSIRFRPWDWSLNDR